MYKQQSYSVILFLFISCINICCKARQQPLENESSSFTPEMFGAIGDNKHHPLSEKFSSIEAAQVMYPQAKDLNITIDGAAFQKAVDAASTKGGGIVVCQNQYVINFPIETKSNVTIDGLGKGKIYNDCSRKKFAHDFAFFIGDHHPVAFNPNGEVPGAYKFYDVANKVNIGDRSVVISNFNKYKDSFKVGQFVWLTSKEKFYQMEYAWFMAQSVTCKITAIKGDSLFFEYPSEEAIDVAQIGANGGIDRFMEIRFAAVENVTIRNLTIDAGNLTNHTWGYHCLIENINLINTTHFIGLNTLDHSTIRNIKGTYYKRCIEIKSGTNHLLIQNIQATFKAPDDTKSSVGIISTGEYNKDIIIDSFFIDLKNSYANQALITVQARNAIIKNGVILSPNHTRAFIKFYNDYNVSRPEFGVYNNKIQNVVFNGNNSMPQLFIFGDHPEAVEKSQSEKKSKQIQWPASNTIENCVMNGGNIKSNAGLYGGVRNKILNCKFSQSTVIYPEIFRLENEIKD